MGKTIYDVVTLYFCIFLDTNLLIIKYLYKKKKNIKKQKKVHQPNEIAPTTSLWYTAQKSQKKFSIDRGKQSQ
jgi:hypothetical protein